MKPLKIHPRLLKISDKEKRELLERKAMAKIHVKRLRQKEKYFKRLSELKYPQRKVRRLAGGSIGIGTTIVSTLLTFIIH